MKFLSLLAITGITALSVTGQAKAYSLNEAVSHTQTANVLQAKTAKHSIITQTASGFAVGRTLPKLPKVLIKNAAPDSSFTVTTDSSTSVDKDTSLQPMAVPLPDLTASTLPTAQPQAVTTAPVARAHTPAKTAVSTPALRQVDGTAYPYADASWPNESVDPWGMYKRQCVSYAAWAVSASGRHMPNWGGSGDAKQWIANARRAGIPVDHHPQMGDVAISTAGTYGHAMYVEDVNDDGSIDISQYNAHFEGEYSTDTRSTTGLVFIHFPLS